MSFVVPLASRPVTERVPAGLSLTVGLATSAVGIWLFTGLTVASSWRALLPGMLVGGVGVGLANPAIAKVALGVVPPQRAGMASGINNTFRIGGVAIGVAALGAVFQSRLQSDAARLGRRPAGSGPGPDRGRGRHRGRRQDLGRQAPRSWLPRITPL